MSKIPNKNVKGQAGGKDAGKLNRRDFLKLSIPAVGLVALGGRSCLCDEVTAAPAAAAPNAVGMLYDSRKCVGCRRCEDACRRWNKLDSEYRPMDLSAKSLTMIKYIKTEGTYADKHALYRADLCQRLPDLGAAQDRRRAGALRRRPLHRLPVLCDRLSFLGTALRLGT
jgi:ferredoxin